MSTSDNAGPHTINGPTIGMLVLDTQFERLPGDAGHAATWRFPMQYARVHGISGVQAISDNSSRVFDAVKHAADELVALGVSAVTTSCGFLARYQRELSQHCPVPVATSSLLQIPQVAQLLPHGKRVGILTSRTQGMTPELFASLGLIDELPVAGLAEDSFFLRRQIDGIQVADHGVLAQEVMQSADGLLARHPEVGALILECANFPPYSAALQRTFGLPVFDLVTLVEWLYGAVCPRQY